MQTFLAGYRAVRELSPTEAAWLKPLMLWRTLRLIPAGGDPTGLGRIRRTDVGRYCQGPMTVDIELSSDTAVIDERLTIRVRGLEPGRPVTVGASVAMRDRCLWSHASFVARPDGTVDLSTDAPVAGSYAGVDAMGLFWSAGPQRRSPHRPAEGGSAILSATVDGCEVAIAQVRRRWARPDVEVVDVRSAASWAGCTERRAPRPVRRCLSLVARKEGSAAGPT